MLALVLPHRHLVRAVGEHVGRLEHGIHQQAGGDQLALGDGLVAELVHPVELADRGDRREHPAQLRVLLHVALAEQDAALGVQAGRHQDRRGVVHALAQRARVVVHGDRVEVDDAVDRQVRAVLALDVLADRPDVVAEVLAPRGLDAGEDDHDAVPPARGYRPSAAASLTFTMKSPLPPRTFPCVAALALAGLSLLVVDPAPSYDAWAWLLWGREVAGGGLSTVDGPAFKPLPVAVCALLAPLGTRAAPWAVGAARAGRRGRRGAAGVSTSGGGWRAARGWRARSPRPRVLLCGGAARAHRRRRRARARDRARARRRRRRGATSASGSRSRAPSAARCCGSRHGRSRSPPASCCGGGGREDRALLAALALLRAGRLARPGAGRLRRPAPVGLPRARAEPGPAGAGRRPGAGVARGGGRGCRSGRCGPAWRRSSRCARARRWRARPRPARRGSRVVALMAEAGFSGEPRYALARRGADRAQRRGRARARGARAMPGRGPRRRDRRRRVLVALIARRAAARRPPGRPHRAGVPVAARRRPRRRRARRRRPRRRARLRPPVRRAAARTADGLPARRRQARGRARRPAARARRGVPLRAARGAPAPYARRVRRAVRASVARARHVARCSPRDAARSRLRVP